MLSSIREPWEKEKTLYKHLYIPYIYLYVYNIECSNFIWLEHILVMFDVIFHVCVCWWSHASNSYLAYTRMAPIENSYMMQIMMMWCHMRGYDVLFSL